MPWAASHPQLWGCWGCCQEGTPRFLLGSLSSALPVLTRRGEKTPGGTARSVSILTREPHFQRIIKLLFNYKQNICAFPLSEPGRVWADRNEGGSAGRRPGVSLQPRSQRGRVQPGRPAGAQRPRSPPASPRRVASRCPGHPPAQSPDNPAGALAGSAPCGRLFRHVLVPASRLLPNPENCSKGGTPSLP